MTKNEIALIKFFRAGDSKEHRVNAISLTPRLGLRPRSGLFVLRLANARSRTNKKKSELHAHSQNQNFWPLARPLTLRVSTSFHKCREGISKEQEEQEIQRGFLLFCCTCQGVHP